jgi:hypothetical protein
LWPPSSHSSLSGGSKGGKPAVGETLHARRPIDARHAGLERRHRQFQAARAQGRDRSAGILELMAAVKFRRRQIEQPVAVLINQPAAFLGRGPVLAGDAERRPHARRLPLDDGERLARLAPITTAGTPRLRMPAFSAAISSMVSPRNSR